MTLKRALAWAIIGTPFAMVLSGFVYFIYQTEGVRGLLMAAGILAGMGAIGTALMWALFEIQD